LKKVDFSSIFIVQFLDKIKFDHNKRT